MNDKPFERSVCTESLMAHAVRRDGRGAADPGSNPPNSSIFLGVGIYRVTLLVTKTLLEDVSNFN